MLHLKNDSMENILGACGNIVVFGAGSLTKLMLDAYADYDIRRKVKAVLDNDSNKDGTFLLSGDARIPVYSAEHFEKQEKKDFALLITPVFFMDIIRQLQERSFFDGICTWVYPCAVNYEKTTDFSIRTTEEEKIPRVIHYIWFGGAAMPEKYRRNIEGWKRLCPDYEIVEWNEKNYDVSRNRYMYQAYERKAWPFVSDYARKDIVYEHGGIYLDTDVEMVKNIDDLLYNELFFGMDDMGSLNSGSGFGAVKGHPILHRFMEDYDKIEFSGRDGKINGLPCGVYETERMIKYGYHPVNQFQKINGVTVYPQEVLDPVSWMGLPDRFSENTFMVHRRGRMIDVGVDAEGKQKRIRELLLEMERNRSEERIERDVAQR